MSTETLATAAGSNAAQPIWKKATSFPVFLGVLLAGGMFLPLRDFWVDPDVWWHIKVGATILATHHWPAVDTYSFSVPGAHWIAYEWLGEVLLAAVSSAWGLRGLLALDFALAAAIVLALYALTVMRCGNSKAAFAICAVLSPLVFASCTLRPQMLGYIFLLLTLMVLERFRRGRTGTLWLLPLIFLAWVNTHGTFAVGILAFAVYWVSGLVDLDWGGVKSRLWTVRERVRLALVMLFSLAALNVTPYGSEVCLYPLNMAFGQPLNVSSVAEWQSMLFSEFFGKLFLALVLGFLLAQITLEPTWRLEELALFLMGLVAACLHVRFLLLFIPFCAPLLAVVVARWIPPYDPAKDKYALNAVLMACVAAAVVWLFPSRVKLQRVMDQKWPVHAVAYLESYPTPGPMYNNYRFGGYLIWRLDGRQKVFIDGRADIYERAGVLADYLAIERVGPATLFLLRAYGFQSCLVQRDEPLATLLAASPEWRPAYSDRLSALYVRRGTQGIPAPAAAKGPAAYRRLDRAY